MHRSLALLLLLSPFLRAESPAPAEAAPTALATPPIAEAAPAAPATPTSSAEPAKPEPPAPEDKELASIRGLLEAAGLRVEDLSPMRSEGLLAVGQARLALSPDPRVREARLMVMVTDAVHPGCWRFILCAGFAERDREASAATSLRAELAGLMRQTRFLRDCSVPPVEREEGEDEDEGPFLLASHLGSAADPGTFAAFALDVSRDLVRVLGVSDDEGGFLMTREEAGRRPAELAIQGLADRLRQRVAAGLPAVPSSASAGPATDDPVSHGSHPLHPAALGSAERLEDVGGLLGELGEPALPTRGREAFRLSLVCHDPEIRPAAARLLKDLAYDPATGAPGDAWALYHWARHLLRTLPEEDGADQVVEALDALRLSARLGCEFALGYYLHLLDCAKEPLVGGESHWEQRLRWDALWSNFSPHETAEALEVERDYRAGDRSPIRFGSSARGEELAQLRLAVDEMNAARKARGWKTFELVLETPAGEEPEDPAERKDPAGAGSVAEG